MPTQKNGQTNPKLQQFVEELTALQDKYLYQLTPVLQIAATGIVPGLKITDKIPPKTDSIKKDLPEVPAVEKSTVAAPVEEKN
jgi:hypothetical protein